MDFEKIKSQVDELHKNDISQTDLGVQNDFSAAENYKNEIVLYQKRILDSLEQISSSIPEVVLEEFVIRITNQINILNAKINDVNSIVSNGVHNQNFPNQRQNKITEFESQKTPFIRQLFQIETDILLFQHNEIINSNKDLTDAIVPSKQNVESIKELLKEAKQMVGNIRDISLVKTLKESAGSFDNLRTNHKTQEDNWFIAFMISIVISIGVIAFIFFTDLDTSSTENLISALFKKGLLLSIPVILIKITLRKYNLERNLKIVYDHRATVLEQYRTFEGAISDEDQEAKNRFRLEIAKYIFSDPQTGYLGDNKSSDVSVNPIINLAESITSK